MQLPVAGWLGSRVPVVHGQRSQVVLYGNPVDICHPKGLCHDALVAYRKHTQSSVTGNTGMEISFLCDDQHTIYFRWRTALWCAAYPCTLGLDGFGEAGSESRPRWKLQYSPYELGQCVGGARGSPRGASWSHCICIGVGAMMARADRFWFITRQQQACLLWLVRSRAA